MTLFQTIRRWKVTFKGLRDARENTLLGAVLCVTVGVLLCGLLVQRPVFGLLGFLCVPIPLLVAIQLLSRFRADKMEDDTQAFFYALRSLLKAGVGFPTAIFHLSGSLSDSFSNELRLQVRHYDEGQSLEHLLARCRLKSGIQRSGLCLSILEMAYRAGLAMVPVLDRMLPLLEAESGICKRIRGMRINAFLQLLFAWIAPWMLLLFLGQFQPSTLNNFMESAHFSPVIFLATSWQILGGVLIWRLSSFH